MSCLQRQPPKYKCLAPTAAAASCSLIPYSLPPSGWSASSSEQLPAPGSWLSCCARDLQMDGLGSGSTDFPLPVSLSSALAARIEELMQKSVWEVNYRIWHKKISKEGQLFPYTQIMAWVWTMSPKTIAGCLGTCVYISPSQANENSFSEI